MNLRKYRWLPVILVFAIFLLLSSTVSFASDYLLFEHLGFEQLLITPLTTQLILGLGVGIFVLVFLYLNLNYASRSNIDWFYTLPEKIVGKPLVLDKKKMRNFILAISFVFALTYGFIYKNLWYSLLSFLNSTPFGQMDPIFSKDISFYVFELPFYSYLNSMIKSLSFITIIVSMLIYFFKGSLSSPNNLQELKDSLSTIYNRGRYHIGILLLVLFSTFAVDVYLDLHRTIITPGGLIFGATYTDIKVQIPLLQLAMYLVIAGMVLTFFYLITRKGFSLIVIVLGLYLLSGPARILSAGIIQQLVVAPNELEKERQYIKNNIEATRVAYDLNKIDTQGLPSEQTLTAEDIEDNQITVKNVRLWDRQPLLSTFSQIQEIRTYYNFNMVTNDRYQVDGELRQIMLSPRELESNSLPNPSWINRHMVYTHGHGVVAGPVNRVTEEGLPVLFVKDLPSQTEKAELMINENSIYYGMQTNDYVIVNSKNQELNYPKGDENVYSSYQGEGGIEISSLWRRLLYTSQFGSSKILLSEDITNESRIQYKRNIMERVTSLAPFLTFDRDPYVVIADGKLYWIVDAYTKTSYYPYSETTIFREQRLNYIRNSVKIVVDAYDGSVDMYITDSQDPLIQTIEKIFPDTFKQMDEMPQSLLDHIRYPEDIFTIQANKYNIYHMREPQVFYNREDQWEIAAIGDEAEGSGGALQPRHLIMRLPEEEQEEFILMLPFTPRGKDNLSAWLAARNDGDKYGKITAFTFPKDTLVFGPKQIIGRINQDEEISRQISLWDQRGSRVVRGPLLVIPVESSLIYVQPLYLQAENGRIPELKRVIVAYENNIEMENTLEQGLARIFGTAVPQEQQPGSSIDTQPSGQIDTQNRELLNRAQQLYEQALEAQRNGNWTEYGNKIEELGEVLNQLQ